MIAQEISYQYIFGRRQGRATDGTTALPISIVLLFINPEPHVFVVSCG